MKAPGKNKEKKSSPPPGRDTFLIFLVVGCGIMAVLSWNFGRGAKPMNPVPPTEGSKGEVKPLSLTDVPLATGDEPIDELFVQSGCAVCHTIPGIELAKGREGPKLVLGKNAPLRLEDPNYKGNATTIREYIQESILNPGTYVVAGYSDRVMPRWYGKRLNAKALDRMIGYLEPITE